MTRYHVGDVADGVYPNEPDGVVEVHTKKSYHTAYAQARLYVAGCRHRYATKEFVGTDPTRSVYDILDMYESGRSCDCQLPTEHGPGVQRDRLCYHCLSMRTQYVRAGGGRDGLGFAYLEYQCSECGRHTRFPVYGRLSLHV